MIRRLTTVLAVFSSAYARACPFCDQGGVEAAQFILAVFVPFAFAVLFFFLAARKVARKGAAADPSRRLFESEKKKQD